MSRIILIVCVIIFIVAWIGFPDIIKCPYKSYTGKPCLFCGTLTSLTLVMHGKMGEALKVNPIGVVTFFSLICISGICIYIGK